MNRCYLAKIYATNNIPISENSHLINASAPIWEIDTPNRSIDYRPAVFLLPNQNEACLEFLLQIDSTQVDSEFCIKGDYYYNEDEYITLFQTVSVDRHSHGRKNIAVKVKLNIILESFILISGNYLKWELTIDDEKKILSDENIEMELYWIFKYSKEYFPRGVPLEIIRELSVACHANWQIQFNDIRDNVIHADPKIEGFGHEAWVLHATTLHVFLRNPPRYDVADKNKTSFYDTRKYNHLENWNELDAIHFQLREFLDSNKDPIATCECEEQAVILQYYLHCLGFAEVLLGYIEGELFLQIDGLVGRGCSNNPRYERVRQKPVTRGYCTNRSRFEHHVFCVDKDKKILDSCIGPHTGDENYSDYCDNSFDPCSTYSPNPFYRRGVVAVDRLVPASESNKKADFFFDIEYGNSLVDKKTPFYFDTDPQKEFVECIWPSFEEQGIFKTHGWNLFCENIMPGYGEVEKVWKFIGASSSSRQG